MRLVIRRFSILKIILLFFSAVYIASIYLKGFTDAPDIITTISIYCLVGAATLTCITFYKIKSATFIVWGGIFLSLCLISLLYCPSVSVGLTSIYSYLAIFILTVCILQLIEDDLDIDRIFSIIILSTIIISLISFIFYKDMLLSDERFGNELVGNANSLMRIMILPINLLIYRCLTKKKNIIISLVSLVLCYTILLFTGSKKGLLIPIFFTLLFIILNKGSRKLKVYVYVFASLFLLYYFIINVPELYNVLGVRVEQLQASYTGRGGEVSGSDMVRLAMRKDGFMMFMSRPIFGYGISAFETIGGYGTYSHNNYIEILTSLGLLGLIAYYFVYPYCILLLFKIRMNVVRVDMCNFFIAAICCNLIYDYGAVSYMTITSILIIGLALSFVRISKDFEGNNKDV